MIFAVQQPSLGSYPRGACTHLLRRYHGDVSISTALTEKSRLALTREDIRNPFFFPRYLRHVPRNPGSAFRLLRRLRDFRARCTGSKYSSYPARGIAPSFTETDTTWAWRHPRRGLSPPAHGILKDLGISTLTRRCRAAIPTSYCDARVCRVPYIN